MAIEFHRWISCFGPLIDVASRSNADAVTVQDVDQLCNVVSGGPGGTSGSTWRNIRVAAPPAPVNSIIAAPPRPKRKACTVPAGTCTRLPDCTSANLPAQSNSTLPRSKKKLSSQGWLCGGGPTCRRRAAAPPRRRGRPGSCRAKARRSGRLARRGRRASCRAAAPDRHRGRPRARRRWQSAKCHRPGRGGFALSTPPCRAPVSDSATLLGGPCGLEPGQGGTPSWRRWRRYLSNRARGGLRPRPESAVLFGRGHFGRKC